MNMKQLRYFYTIATEGQITRAAKKLHMAQPPLSQSLKALEDDLGVKLLERNGRRMELTAAGKVLYERAKSIFQDIDEIKIEVRETGKGMRGSLSIGCVKSCFSYLPKAIHLFRNQYPHITFKLKEGDSFQLTEDLNNRIIETAIVRFPLDVNEYSYYQLPSEKYVIVMPVRWAEKYSYTSLPIRELANFPLLLLHRISGRGQFELIMERFADQGLTPNLIGESPNVDMLLGLVNEEIGVTIVPKSTLLDFHLSGLRVLQIEDATILSESAIIWLKNRYLSKSASHFIERLKQTVAN